MNPVLAVALWPSLGVRAFLEWNKPFCIRPGKRSNRGMNLGDLSSRAGLGLSSKSRTGAVCAVGPTMQQKPGIKLSRQASGHILHAQPYVYIPGLISLSGEMRSRCLNFSWTFSTAKWVQYVLGPVLGSSWDVARVKIIS